MSGAAAKLVAELTERGPQPLAERARDLAARHGHDGDRLVSELARLLFFADRCDLLERRRLPFPRYDFRRDVTENEDGPVSLRTPSQRPAIPGRAWTVLGQRTGMPIGIPACPLTMNARWVEFYARRGYNVITYKTVRSAARPALPGASWYFATADPATPDPEQLARLQVRAGPDAWPAAPSGFSTVNSFGVPSKEPASWQEDVRDALRALAPDQLLILSVMGNFERYRGEDLAADFAHVAVLGSETGARALELNLSCPNGVADGRPLPALYLDPGSVHSVVRSVRGAVGNSVALVIKIGFMSPEQLRNSLEPVAHLVDAVAGINALQLPVRASSGAGPAFPDRLEAGVSGHVIARLARHFVESLAALRTDLGAGFDILAMGGVEDVEDVRRLHEAGATAVQSASGAMFDPNLPARLTDRADDVYGPPPEIG